MPESQTIKRTDFKTHAPLPQMESGWYRETLIENHTGQLLYIMHTDGEIQEVAPLYKGPNFGQRVLVKQIQRVGLPDANPGFRTSVNAVKHPRSDFEISLKDLDLGPVYLRQVGITLALGNSLPRLRESNYLDPDFCNAKATEIAVDFLNQGYPSPMLIIGNCHDESINFLHVEVNGVVMSIKLRHERAANEELRFLMNRKDSHCPWKYEGLDWNKLDVANVTIGKTKWIIGTDIEKVHKRVQEKLAEQENKFTVSEVNTKVTERTQHLEQKLNESETRSEIVQKELKLVKDELANTKTELNRANDVSRASFEQQQLAAKMAMQVQDQDFSMRKQLLEQQRLETIMTQARLKTDADLAIAQAKVQKESISVQGAEASNLGTLAKTVTIVAPIVAAAAAWMHRQNSTSTAITAAIGGLSAARYLPIVGAVVTTVILAKRAVSVVKHTINVISSKAKQFWSWLTA